MKCDKILKGCFTKPWYQIRSTLCSVITLASVVPMVVGVTVLIVTILHNRLLEWID